MLLRLHKDPWRLVVSVAVVFFVLSLIFTLHRHFSFYASYDQGIFNQVFWNGIHGRFFQSSLSSTLSTNVVHDGQVPEVFYHRLGQHFTPALLLWLPLYALFPSPVTLIVLQVTLVTCAGGVLYLLAREYLEPALAARIAVSFYAANAIIGPTLSNFHDLCQIPLFVFGLLLAMEKRWWWLFWLLAILILAVREDSGVILFGVGFYAIVSKRFPRVGLALCTLSFAYMVILTNAIMPLFSQDISRRFMIERFGQYVDNDKATTLDILWAIISKPWRLIAELFSPFFGTIKYLLGQWLPLAFVPALSPASWAIAGFPLLQIFMQRGESAIAINIRYAMAVVPGLFYGAILWWHHHPEWFKKPSFRRFWAICIGLSLLFCLTSNPNRTFSFLIPDSIQPWVYVSLPRQWHHVGYIRSFLKQIPPDASVSASTYIVPHLSSRREILRFPDLQLRNDAREVEKVDYAIADLWQLQQYQTAFKSDRQKLQETVPVIEQVTGSGEYGIVDFKDGVIFMQKGVASEPAAVAAWQVFRKEIEPILQKPA
ncbi:DUF2079 domain-containing protein [Microcoleus sp. FACHB-68]|uniref:DUF2079 domain-containing protein n=1 Tax=Microcoleus sp. FACHB-68 TaxID=2692826 RepID=UPI001681C532|nr:DUF2079 domain-containing protein [Microcoleus sp. FACHB-68]MBD1940058.1 DUF2079 domain-containing protein [Microcoleus sp. FACHB-68]